MSQAALSRSHGLSKRAVTCPDPEVERLLRESGIFTLPGDARIALLQILQHRASGLMRVVPKPQSFFLATPLNPLSTEAGGILLGKAYRNQLMVFRSALYKAHMQGAGVVDSTLNYLRAQLSAEE